MDTQDAPDTDTNSYHLFTATRADIALCEIALLLIYSHDTECRSNGTIDNPFGVNIFNALIDVLFLQPVDVDPDGRQIGDRVHMDWNAAVELHSGLNRNAFANTFRNLSLRQAQSTGLTSKETEGRTPLEVKCTWAFWHIVFQKLKEFRASLNEKVLPRNNGVRQGEVQSRKAHGSTRYARAKDKLAQDKLLRS